MRCMDDKPLSLPEVLPAGIDAVLVRFGLQPLPRAISAAQMLAADLAADPLDGVTETAAALASVLLRFDPAVTVRARLADEALRRATRISAAPLARPEPLRRWTIPASFVAADGPQLAQVARQLAVSEAEAVRQLCAADLRVLAIGFAPGQPYIGLLPEGWDLPRLPVLTPAVPVGAIVVAVRQIVMFAAPSSTGWQQLGRTAFRSFQPERTPPIPLRAGDSIRYVPVSPAEIAQLARQPDGLGGARLEVLR